MKKHILLVAILLIMTGCTRCTPKPTPKQDQTNLPAAVTTASYHVYIENSASMDGYVNGVTEFKTAVYNYLSDLNIADLTDSLHLNYINSKEIPYGSDIADFIEKLDPATFRARGGNRGTTDISNVLKMVLKGASKDNINILISDFIFSPGKGKDAEQYLVNQQIGIKNSMAQHLKEFPDHGVVIYQLESKFNGAYYNKFDNVSQFNGSRPYYIWIIGERNRLLNQITQCPAAHFKGGGVKNIFSITKGVPIKYAVQYGSGNFKLDKKDTQRSIVEAKKDTKGVGEKKLRFHVNADLCHLLMDDAYLLNTENYDVNDKDYQLDIQKNHSGNGYSHTLKLSTPIVKPSTVTIRLKIQVPSWVNEINDDQGIDIQTASGQTYGFKYLIDGIYEAYTKDGTYCTEIKVNVNQKK